MSTPFFLWSHEGGEFCKLLFFFRDVMSNVHFKRPRPAQLPPLRSIGEDNLPIEGGSQKCRWLASFDMQVSLDYVRLGKTVKMRVSGHEGGTPCLRVSFAALAEH